MQRPQPCFGAAAQSEAVRRCEVVKSCGFWPRVMLVLSTAMALTGCADKYPPVYKVTGRLVFKNGKGNMKALSQNANLEFQSLTDAAEKPGSEIGPDGSLKFFSMRANKAVPGIKEGTYKARVLFTAAEDPEHPKNHLVDPKYLSFKTTPLEFTIQPGDNDIVIEIEAGK
jgi:hypothetical protein